jgi:hypothetical protein
MIRLALLLAMASSPVAAAQCGPRQIVIDQLAQTYGEARVGIGMAAGGNVLEVWSAPAGTWTVTVTTPAGVTCLMASGDGYETITEVAVTGEPG